VALDADTEAIATIGVKEGLSHSDLSRPEHEGLREGLRIYMEWRIGKIRVG